MGFDETRTAFPNAGTKMQYQPSTAGAMQPEPAPELPGAHLPRLLRDLTVGPGPRGLQGLEAQIVHEAAAVIEWFRRQFGIVPEPAADVARGPDGVPLDWVPPRMPIGPVEDTPA